MSTISTVFSTTTWVALLLVALSSPLRSQQPTLGSAAAGEYADMRSFLFTENIGQWESETAFQGRAGSVMVRFTRTSVDYFYAVDSIGSQVSRRTPHGYTLGTEFLGAHDDVRIDGTGRTATRYNYFLGAAPSEQYTGAAVYGNVRYNGLYDGIDALYSGNDGRMKYDFIVAPGADYRQIRIRYHGARALKIGGDGALEVATPFGTVRDAAPYCYQEIGGKQVAVRASYHLLGENVYGFRLGAYDPTRPVVIDPCLSIEYGTYLGGGGYDVVTNMAVDSVGFAYAVGFTNAIDFPRVPAGPYQSGNYVFISKIAEDGSSLIYSTILAQPYVGAYASGTETYYESIGEDVEVTASGEAVVALTTNVPGLATTGGAFRRTISVNPDTTVCPPLVAQNYDVYVTRLDVQGKMKWGTYLGGGDNDYVTDIALDRSENVCLTGTTYSLPCADGQGKPIGDTLRFPVTVPKDRFSTTDTLKGFETFVARLTSDGRQLTFGAVYGGRGDEFAGKIAVDQSGRIYIFGNTNSPDLHTTPNAYHGSPSAGLGGSVYDLYIARIDPTAATLDYSSYFPDGGGAGRRGLGVGVFSDRVGLPMAGFATQQRHQGFALDRQDGVVVFGGSTRSSTLPVTSGALRGGPPSPGDYDGFIVRFDINTNKILAATYIGGSGADYLGGLSIDAFGDIAVGVSTTSNDFPLSAVSIQKKLLGQADAAIAVISADGQRLQYGSYIGGSTPSGPQFQWEQSVTGVLTEKTGALYLYGATSSRDLPITGSAFFRDNDYYSGYIIKFTAPTAPRVGTTLGIEFPGNACSSLETALQEIFNSGQGPLRIDSIAMKFGQHFRLVNPPPFPIILDPCDTITLTVGFEPDSTAICDRTVRDSMIIYAANAIVKRSAVYLSGVKRCLRFNFMQTEIDDPKYWLGSNIRYHFRASVQGEMPQYLTITPNPGNKGIFRPSPQQINEEYRQGSAFVDFEVNAPDTGRYCESFTATIQPCDRTVQLNICAYVKSGIFNAVDSINYGLISCRDIEQPITIYNTGNDTLRWRIWFVGFDNAADIEYDPNLGFFQKLPEHDSVTFIVRYRPKGVGNRLAAIVFETNERAERRYPKIVFTAELDTVSFQLSNPSLVGSYGETIALPIDYESIREGRVPTTDLTFLAKFDPKLLAVTGVDVDGTLTDGWDVVEQRDTSTGTIIRVVMGPNGRPLLGDGTLARLRLKVLRGDTIATPLGIELAGVSQGCLDADVDTTQLFTLSAECQAYDRLLFSGNRLLKQSVPNPAHDEVRIPFRVPDAGQVTLRLYDMLGREVLQLLDENLAAGNYEVVFPATALPAGRYYYRLTIGNDLSDTREMVIE